MVSGSLPIRGAPENAILNNSFDHRAIDTISGTQVYWHTSVLLGEESARKI